MMSEPIATTGVSEPKPLSPGLQRLKEATGQVVGSLFYGTMLHTMRESKLNGTYGHGGRGEEVFAAQLDGLLAERAGSASSRGLGDFLYRHLAHQQKLITDGKLDTAA